MIEDLEGLSWLCHYIALNPVRAGICTAPELKNYRYGSCWYLRKRAKRPSFMDFEACLDGAGDLRDSSYGWRRHEQYLTWLSEDEPRMKAMLFDRMGKGWAIGSEEFKLSLIDDEKRMMAAIELGDADAREARELAWGKTLGRCLGFLGKNRVELDAGLKSADWKVAVAGYLKKKRLCRNGWLAERLAMGSESGVSRYVSQMLQGKRPEALKSYERLMTKIKH